MELTLNFDSEHVEQSESSETNLESRQLVQALPGLLERYKEART